MPNYQVISQANYANKRWLRYTSYAFAMKEAVMPLAMAELPKAAISLPIGFIAQEDSFTPVAVMSVQPQKNLFVALDGRWIHSYIPAALRSYPFHLANTTDGQQVLCIDEDSGLVNDGPEGEAFFDDEGKAAPAIIDIMNFLSETAKSRQATANACAVLKTHGLIKPWPITLRTDNGEQTIEGLFQIDESALNQLPADALLAVRDAGGLLVAYCQMLSMQHLSILGQLASAHAKAAAATQITTPSGDLDLEMLKKSDSISFSGF